MKFKARIIDINEEGCVFVMDEQINGEFPAFVASTGWEVEPGDVPVVYGTDKLVRLYRDCSPVGDRREFADYHSGQKSEDTSTVVIECL